MVSRTLRGGKYAIKGSTNVPRDTILVLLLHQSGALQRNRNLQVLKSMGYHHILSVETPQSYSGADISSVQYLILNNTENIATQINVGIQESIARFVLVINDSMTPTHTMQHLFALALKVKTLCIVPTLLDQRGHTTSSVYVPVMSGRHFRVLQTHAVEQGSRTLFPHTYFGLYNREKFIHVGGYDLAILQPYWQLCDFGMRANLWGERIITHTSYSVKIDNHFSYQDTTVGRSYKRFYLKNILPRYNHDGCVLKMRELPAFLLRFRDGVLRNYILFFKIKQWIRKHRYRFQQDYKKLIELWDSSR